MDVCVVHCVRLKPFDKKFIKLFRYTYFHYIMTANAELSFSLARSLVPHSRFRLRIHSFTERACEYECTSCLMHLCLRNILLPPELSLSLWLLSYIIEQLFLNNSFRKFSTSLFFFSLFRFYSMLVFLINLCRKQDENMFTSDFSHYGSFIFLLLFKYSFLFVLFHLISFYVIICLVCRQHYTVQKYFDSIFVSAPFFAASAAASAADVFF